MIKQKWRKNIALLILFTFMLTLLPANDVLASTYESADGFSRYTSARISESDNFPFFLITNSYNINVNGSRKGTGKLFNLANNWGPGWHSGKGLSGFTYIKETNVGDWANALNGNVNHIKSKSSSTSITPGQKLWNNSNMTYESASIKSKDQFSSSGSSVTHRHIRLITELSGAKINSFTNGESGSISIQTSEKPLATLSVPSSAKIGETYTVKASGTCKALSYSSFDSVKLQLYEDGRLIKTEEKRASKAEISMPMSKSTKGTYEYKLVVTDRVQRTSEVTKTITIGDSPSGPVGGSGGTKQPAPSPPSPPSPPPNPPNAPWVQVSVPPTVNTGEPYRVEYSVWKDQDVDIIDFNVYVWFDSPRTDTSPTGREEEHWFFGYKEFISEKPGTVFFRVEVTDSNGLKGANGASTEVLYVPPPPKPPETEILAPSFVNEGTEFDITALSKAFEGRHITSWQWTLPSEFQKISGNFTNDEGGKLKAPTGSAYWKSYDIKLKVTDNEGLTGEAIAPIRVGRGPDVTITAPAQVGRGQSFTVTENITLYGGATLEKKEWTISNAFEGIETFTFEKNGGTLKARQDAGGNYRIKLKVTDSNGGEAEAEAFVYVLMGPTAVLQYVSPIIEGQPTTIRNLSYPNDPGSTITSVSWEIDPIFEVEGGFVDGKDEYIVKAPFDTYPATKYPNTFPVKLTVTDSNGRTMTTTANIEVILRPENQAPEAMFYMPTETYRDIIVNITEQSKDTDGGQVVKWEWILPDGCEEVEPFDPDNRDENGRATYKVKFNKLGTHQIKLIVTDDGTETNFTRGVVKTNEIIKNITVKNMPPVANFTWMDNPMQGQDVEVINHSVDHDGEIVNAKWIFTPSADVIPVEPLGLDGGTVYFDKPGDYTLKLKVTDNDGATDEIEKGITVAPAIPEAFIYDDPYHKKQNRLVTFYGEFIDEFTGESKASWTPDRYPIIWDEAEWIIKPVSAGISQDDIKIRDDSDLRKRQVVFKKPGEYYASLKVKNTAGYWSEPYEMTFFVEPDEPPIADFFVATAYIREIDEDNPTELAKATIRLIDTSYSIDGDDIVQRIWKYKYDSNNDGSFADEPWEILSDANETEPSLTVTDVGRYYFELEVVEGFDSPTLPEFISPEDYLRANTDNKLMIEKVVEVVNIAPTVSWDYKKKEKVDVVFALGDVSAETKTSLENNMALLQAQLEEAGFDAKVTFNETVQVDSNSQDAKMIFNEWVDFPEGAGTTQWQLDEVNGILWSPTNPPFETGFYDPNAYNIKDFSLRSSIKANQIAQPMGYIYKLNPTYIDSNGIQRYDVYFLWISSKSYGTPGNYVTVPTVFKAEDYYFNYSKTATPLALFDIDILNGFTEAELRYGWANHPPYNYGGYPHGTPMQKGLTVTNVNDPTIKSTIMDFHIMPAIDHTAWYDLEVIVNGKRTIVNWNGTKIMDFIDENMIEKGSYGFFQFSHVNPMFKNIIITTQSQKTLDEVVKSHTWRQGSHKFIADVHDGSYQPEYLDKPPRISVLFGDLLSGEIDLSIFGNASNKDTAEQMIALNDNEGTFIYNNDDMSGPLYEYGNYIINKIRSKEDKKDYLIVNEDEIIIDPAYSDTENDPWIAERWKYLHDPDWFENPMGLANYHDVYIPNPVIIFDKTGEYQVDMQRRDNPKNDIRFDNYRQWSQPLVDDPFTLYVHRKPVPQFTFKLEDIGTTNKQKITIAENSFDLDNESKGERGIARKEWYWKEATSTTWIAGKPTEIEKNKSYLVKLIVEDFEGVVVQDVKAVVNSDNMPPVAKFIVNPNPAIAKKPFTITDLSYDPNGDIIVEWNWRVRTPANVWQDYGSTKPVQFDELGLYVIELKVKDEHGLWSEPYSQDVMVNNLAPVAQFTMNPNPAATGETVTFTDTSYDPNGDNIVERKWTLTDPLGNETEYINSMPPSTYTLVGDWIVTLEVKDEHGLWSAPTSRILIILNTPPHAQFTMVPNPAKINEIVTFTNLSWDTDGHSMSFDWDITREGYGLVEMFSDGVKNTPYSFTKSFDIEGKYFVRLVATDEFGAKGETIHSLIVWTPLEIVDSDLNPNPAQAGIRITATIQTDGYAESVKLTYNDPKLGIQVVNLKPSNVLPSKVNTWTGRFRTSPWIPDGAYPVYIEANRSGVTGISGPQTETKTLILNIEGTVYDDTRTTIKN